MWKVWKGRGGRGERGESVENGVWSVERVVWSVCAPSSQKMFDLLILQYFEDVQATVLTTRGFRGWHNALTLEPQSDEKLHLSKKKVTHTHIASANSSKSRGTGATAVSLPGHSTKALEVKRQGQLPEAIGSMATETLLDSYSLPVQKQTMCVPSASRESNCASFRKTHPNIP